MPQHLARPNLPSATQPSAHKWMNVAVLHTDGSVRSVPTGQEEREKLLIRRRHYVLADLRLRVIHNHSYVAWDWGTGLNSLEQVQGAAASLGHPVPSPVSLPAPACEYLRGRGQRTCPYLASGGFANPPYLTSHLARTSCQLQRNYSATGLCTRRASGSTTKNSLTGIW